MGEDKDEYKRFTISLPRDLYKDFELFRETLDMTRSDCIRKAMKSYMISEENTATTNGNVIGCIPMVLIHEHFAPDDSHPHDHNHPHDSDHQHDHEYISRPIYAKVQQTDHILRNDIQHHFRDIIISNMHIHLEFEKCMEIIAVSGPYERVKKLKNDLQRLKSVISIGFFVVDKEYNTDSLIIESEREPL